MPTPEQKRWCLEQAIEIVKHAPADSHVLHDRLKRVYKRLQILLSDAAESSPPATSKAMGATDGKAGAKKAKSR
jgi:hypothetical protein